MGLFTAVNYALLVLGTVAPKLEREKYSCHHRIDNQDSAIRNGMVLKGPY